jgi:hypothetical protein
LGLLDERYHQSDEEAGLRRQLRKVNRLAEMTIYDDPPALVVSYALPLTTSSQPFPWGFYFNLSFSLLFKQLGLSFPFKLIIMAGGAPIPVPITAPEEKILCIADLEKAGSRKMEKGARGESQGGMFRLILLSYFPVMPFNIFLLYG